MRSRWYRLAHDERGMSLVFVGVTFFALLSATTIAIDVGMFMTAKTQAQTSADAGALAGATALAFNSFTDRSASGPAVQSAVNTALANRVAASSVSVTSDDVTFPLDPVTGQADRVGVTVYRTDDRSNSVPTLMGAFFGIQRVNIAATAIAEAAAANGVGCVKPFTIPDRWIENVTPPWNSMTSTFDRYYTNGNRAGQVMTPTADEYPPPGDSRYVGYSMTGNDIGTLLTIRAGTGNNVSPTMYFSWAMPNNTGADDYTANIAGCNPTIVHRGQIITQEPGNMVGPTNQGIDDLLLQDPSAEWGTSCNCVINSRYPGHSPRVFPIPLYDPDYYQDNVTNGRNATLRVANWIGFFVVSRNGNDVLGRITPILGVIDSSLPPGDPNSLARAIRLVQ
jgi:Putative Flp pilus-assembly TadE/G-like